MHLPEFEQLGLAAHCIDALIFEGYTKPTPIQSAAIPPLLSRRDLLGCAQTGTGKTAAFALPTIQLLLEKQVKREKYKARALVVAPTRELAIQIDQSFAAYGRGAGLKRACVYGGVGKMPQVKAMERGVDVLVATPGRLLDLRQEGYIDLSAVEIAILDEADRMLDMGFINDVRKIMALLPKKRQTALFSATMPREIEDLGRTFLENPVRVAIEPDKPAVELIDQKLYYVEKGDKRSLLSHLIKELGVARAVVFSRTKHGADRIARGLHQDGIPAGVIHANKGQGNRTKTMEAFRAGETPILVATDIAARGIDVDDITHVFNFDQPTEPETYVHRIGRTARAGASGTAISFCDTEEKKFLRQVEKLLGKPIPVVREHPWATGSGRAGESREEADTDDRPRNRPSGQARLGYGQTKSRQGASRQGAFAGIGKPRRGQSGRQFGGKPASSVERPGSQAKTGQRSKDGSAQPAAARRDDKPSVRQVEQRPSGGEHRSQKPIDTGSSGRKDIRSAINELTGRGKR